MLLSYPLSVMLGPSPHPPPFFFLFFFPYYLLNCHMEMYVIAFLAWWI